MHRIHALVLSALISCTLAFTHDARGQAAASQPGVQQPPASTQPRRPNRPNAGPARGGDAPVPANVQVVRDVVYATADDKDGKPVELKMDCAFLKQSDGKPLPVVMYIHGGGWSGGDRSVGLPFCYAFAAGGYFSCTVQYRLSGQATYPAQLHDVKAAVRFLRANADELGIDPDRIGVWGHSAGAHLSALLGVTGNDLAQEGEVGVRDSASAVQAVVEVSGPSDLVLIAPGGNGGPMIAGLLGGTVAEKPALARQASPVTHVDAADAPFLIIQGGKDRLVPDDQAEAMRDALKEANVEVEYLYIAEADHGVRDRRAFRATAEFFDAHLGGHAAESMAELARRFTGAAPAATRPRSDGEQ